MYKATREFITAREQFTGNYSVRHLPNVKKVGGGLPNRCYTNSHNAKDSMSNGTYRVVMISGWLVQPYNKSTNSTAIIAHWWNADINGGFLDTTPLINDGEEYVQDSAIYHFCVENDNNLTTHLPNSLLYRDGKFEVLIDPVNMLFRPINELRTEFFYELTNSV